MFAAICSWAAVISWGASCWLWWYSTKVKFTAVDGTTIMIATFTDYFDETGRRNTLAALVSALAAAASGAAIVCQSFKI
jgi:hypothetical protein